MFVKRNIKALYRNRCSSGKTVSIAYSERVSVALLIQHAKRKRRIVLPSVACFAISRFSTLSLKRYDFREKGIEYKMCVSIFATVFV
jgi:hypothetical protein